MRVVPPPEANLSEKFILACDPVLTTPTGYAKFDRAATRGHGAFAVAAQGACHA